MEQVRNSAAIKMALRDYLQQMKRDWFKVVLAFLLPAIGSILVFYVPPLIIAKLLARYTENPATSMDQFIPYLLAFILLWGAGEFFWRAGIHFLIKVEASGTKQLYINAMDRLLEKDMDFFHNNFAGSLTKRVTSYSWKYIDLMETLTFNIFSAYLPLIFVVFILWHFSPWLVLVLIGLMFITACFVVPLIRRRQKLVAARESASTRTSGVIADILGNIDTVKAFANEDFERQEYYKRVDDLTKKAKHSWDYQNQKIDVLMSPFFVLTNALGLVIALWLSTNRGVNIAIVFVTFNYYAGVTRSMWEFNRVYRNIESAMTEGAQFTELLIEPPAVCDIVKPKTLKITAGGIEFRDLLFSFKENDGGQHLFKDFNLTIKPGEKIALVGHSGSGKTTLSRLLMRFMNLSSGQILIDGQDISQVKQDNLRSNIAFVPQEPAMFHRTIADNIRYGRLDATQAEIEKAARDAYADDFVKGLNKAYETLVGERGIKLSGGQKQRIAIARAMIKNAPILILDEATSALDSESEKYIQSALWKLMNKRTVIVIAHRLSTIQRMDRIIVLDNGRIAEQGNHRQLIKSDGVYARLWAHQSGGFLED